MWLELPKPGATATEGGRDDFRAFTKSPAVLRGLAAFTTKQVYSVNSFAIGVTSR